MTLDEAIKKARDSGMELIGERSSYEKGLEYIELAKLLEELRAYRMKYPRPSTYRDII